VDLTCGAKFYFKFCAQLIFSKFVSEILFQNIMSEYFFQCFLQNLFFLVFDFLQILAYEFYFPTKFLYKSFVFEYYCTSKFVIIFLRLYVLYIILYLNKLYNFQLSLNNYSLDLT
jgi:hypothetical protein